MIDPSCLADFTWAEIAQAAKAAMIAAAMGGKTLSINGRELGRITIDEATQLYDFAVKQAAIEATCGDESVVLVEFVDPARMYRGRRY